MAIKSDDDTLTPEEVVTLEVGIPRKLMTAIEEYSRANMTSTQSVVRIAIADYLTNRGRLR